MTDQSGYVGHQETNTFGNQFSVHKFLIESLINQMATATLVKVMKCTNNGEVSEPGYVDILPLVNQIDGIGRATPHITVYHCPYIRVQSGDNAVIIDPKPGDIGLAVICDHDTSAVEATKGQANPGSRRRFDLSDAVYITGLLNKVPKQYIRFTDDEIFVKAIKKIHLDAGEEIDITAPTIKLNGSTEIDLTSPTIKEGSA